MLPRQTNRIRVIDERRRSRRSLRARCTGERLAEQLAQRVALLGAECREHLVLDAVHPLLCALDRVAAGVGERHDVAATVVGVAAPRGVAGALQLVEQQHEVVRVEAERLAERLLRHLAAVVAQVRERHVLLQAHAEQRLAAAAVHDLPETGKQHHRSGSGGGCHGTRDDSNVLGGSGIIIHIGIIHARVNQIVTPEQIAQAHADRRRWIAFVVVCLGQLMIVLDVTIVNVALPSIQKDLHFSQANLAWVVDAYLIAFGSFLLLGGRLGDLVGRKRVFLSGLVLFTIASALCGLADDQTLLIVARFVQGLGGAITSAVILAIVVTEFPEPADRAKAMSIYTFVAVGGGSVGLILGGIITQAVDWHWIFLVNVPIGIAAFALGFFLIDESEAIGFDDGVDVLGSFLVTVGAMLVVFAIVKSTDYGWTSAHTLGFGGAGIALLAVFFLYESRVSNPIMPLRILRLRSLIGSSAVRGLLVTGMFGMFFLGALYFEHVLGYSALQTGLAFLPQTLTVAVLSLGITAKLLGRFGAMRLLIPGLALMAVGQLILATAGEHAQFFPTIFLALFVTGLGAGTSFMPLLTIAMADVPPRDAGLASGVINVSMQISAAIGIAILGALATHRTKSLVADHHALRSALTSGYHLSFLIGAGCIVAAIVVSLLVLRTPGGPRPAEATVRAPAHEAEREPQPA